MPTASFEQKRVWEERIQQQKASGLSIERWCRENQIPAWKFHYWKSKLSPILLTRTSFVECARSQNPGITIECGRYLIHLDKYFDAATLKQCLAVLEEIKC
jgi:hypothetical protein